MPFIGRDWRSPGDNWVKTHLGWERARWMRNTIPGPHNSQLSSLEEHHSAMLKMTPGDQESGLKNIATAQTDSNRHAERLMICGSLESNTSSNQEDSDTNSIGDNEHLADGMHSSTGSGSEGNISASSSEGTPPPGIVLLEHMMSSSSGSSFGCTPLDLPHCRISRITAHNCMSEAFYQLDFANAISDIRRFNYVCKVLLLIINEYFTSLSGQATKCVLTMIENIAYQVASTQQNIHILHELLRDLQAMLDQYQCWGRPLGSTQLWKQHISTIERITELVKSIEIKESETSDDIQLTDLPAELIREIVLRLNDYRDLVNARQAVLPLDSRYKSQVDAIMASSTQNGEVQSVQGEKSKPATPQSHSKTARNSSLKYQQPSQNGGQPPPDSIFWRKLCQYHFTPAQITHEIHNAPHIDPGWISSASRGIAANSMLQSSPVPPLTNQEEEESVVVEALSERELYRQIHWEKYFHKLRKKYGLREEYADTILLCRHCYSLFWKSIGHPCVLEDNSCCSGQHHAEESAPHNVALHVPIPPRAFLQLFPL